MLGLIETYGPFIISGIISVGALAGAIYNIRKCIKLGKKIDTTAISLEKNAEITRAGIVEAFKSAKLPNEIRLSLSTKVEEVLNQATNKIIEIVTMNEAQRTNMTAMALKILSYTAAANKLTEDEKLQIEDLLKLIEDDTTIINI